MATPKRFQQQLEQAEAQLAEQQKQATPSVQVVTDPSQLLIEAPTPPQSAAPAPAPTPPAAPPAEDWEQKYKSLNGRFAAEMAPLRAQTVTQQSELAALRDQVKALQAAAAAQQPKPQPAPPDPRDVESYGADMIDMVKRYAQQTFQAVVEEVDRRAADFDSRLKRVEEAITGVSHRTETTLEQQFYATLKQLVPDWETINQSDEFFAWLAEGDPVYGVPRQVALNNAHERRDVERVAATFNAFKSSRPAKPSAALAAQQTPSGSGAGAPTVTPAEPVQLISASFVQKFYADQLRGRYRGREAEAQRIEASINQAAAEGRITP